MDKQLKWAGAALAAGGLLMFTRMIPVIAVMPDDMAFPPAATEDLVRLATIAGSRWQISHLMGLAAVILFATAYALHTQLMLRLGRPRVGIAIAAAATLAYGLFALALVFDGFLLPVTIEAYVASASSQTTALQDVADSHSFALRFYTPGVFFMFVAMGLLSSPIIHRAFHTRWFGFVGQFIAITAVTAYFTGVTGSNWENLQISGTLMLAAFAWHLVLGFRTLFASWRSQEKQSA
jgi:hypothetical protein